MKIEPLSKSTFEPYGDVIEVNKESTHFPINYGYTERYHDLANIDVSNEGGKPGVSIFVSNPLSMPMSLKVMERHPLSSQAFIPMDEQPYLVVVAPCGVFTRDKCRAFIANSNQGVNYHAGTWHHFCLALNQQSKFLVIDRIPKDTSKKVNNCDEFILEDPILLSEKAIHQAISKIVVGPSVHD